MMAVLAIRCWTVIGPPSETRDATSAVSLRAEIGAPVHAPLNQPLHLCVMEMLCDKQLCCRLKL